MLVMLEKKHLNERHASHNITRKFEIRFLREAIDDDALHPYPMIHRVTPDQTASLEAG